MGTLNYINRVLVSLPSKRLYKKDFNIHVDGSILNFIREENTVTGISGDRIIPYESLVGDRFQTPPDSVQSKCKCCFTDVTYYRIGNTDEYRRESTCARLDGDDYYLIRYTAEHVRMVGRLNKPLHYTYYCDKVNMEVYYWIDGIDHTNLYPEDHEYIINLIDRLSFDNDSQVEQNGTVNYIVQL